MSTLSASCVHAVSSSIELRFAPSTSDSGLMPRASMHVPQTPIFPPLATKDFSVPCGPADRHTIGHLSLIRQPNDSPAPGLWGAVGHPYERAVACKVHCQALGRRHDSLPERYPRKPTRQGQSPQRRTIPSQRGHHSVFMTTSRATMLTPSLEAICKELQETTRPVRAPDALSLAKK